MGGGDIPLAAKADSKLDHILVSKRQGPTQFGEEGIRVLVPLQD